MIPLLTPIGRAFARCAFLFTFAVLGSFALVSQLSAAEPGKTQHLASPDAVPDGLNRSDWTSIRAAYDAQRHAAVPINNGYRVRNSGQQWQTNFDGRGFTTQPDGGGWQWGLELRSYGFSGHERVVTGKPEIKAEGSRVTYTWDAMVREWFVNDRRGLEHGFTVEQRPAGSGVGTRLEFDLSVRGDLRPEISADGAEISFVDSSGAAVVTYTELKVWDADGKALPARFQQLVPRHSLRR